MRKNNLSLNLCLKTNWTATNFANLHDTTLAGDIFMVSIGWNFFSLCKTSCGQCGLENVTKTSIDLGVGSK